MPIRRSQYQSKQTLQEFYRNKHEWKGAYASIASRMIDFIDLVEEHFTETQLIATTSHLRLCIQDRDEDHLNWVIIVASVGLDEYYFEYKVPECKSPWSNAWMRGTAKDLNEALIFLIKSMWESEVWKQNDELRRLKKKLGI